MNLLFPYITVVAASLFLAGYARRVTIETYSMSQALVATQMALDKASDVDAPFSAMPCCIRDGIYFRRMSHVDEQSRYTAAVGIIAGIYGADKVTAIDERITNRNLIAMKRT